MNKPRLFGVIAGCAAAAAAGFLLARQSGPSASMDGMASITRSRSGATDHGRAGRIAGGAAVKSRTPEQLAALMEDLRQRYASSATPDQDWALRAEAAAILAILSPAELDTFVNERFRPNEPAQILPWVKFDDPLLREILRHWGAKDPSGTCLALAGQNLKYMSIAYDDWFSRDPAAARTWLANARLPQAEVDTKKLLILNSLKHQATTDFPAACETLGTLTPEAQKGMLLTWSSLLAHDPAKRGEFLALLASRGDSELMVKCYQKLVREMAVKSPADAAAFVETTDLTEDQKDLLSQQVIGEWALKDPKPAFAAWAELKEDEVSAPLLRAIDSWSLNFPGTQESVEWVIKLDPGPAREQFKNHLIECMSSFDRYQQAAELSATLDDPAERLRQLESIKRKWVKQWPKGANAWYDKLARDDREAAGEDAE